MMVHVGQRIEVTVSGKKVVRVVHEVTTCPFGTTLPTDYLDITDDEDEKLGVRVGIK